MVLIDAITRVLPSALGHDRSALEDSFTHGLLDCPHYTRPETFHGLSVPEVLLSGNHQAISQWRHKKSLQRTWQKRPDLLKTRQLTEEEQQILQMIQQRGPNNDKYNRSD
jgi:tRNA (guanine37-N1)-methyltransferase